jgi:peptidoglycan L-alanyl-D-glutamate endopeptidase CwlK
MASFGNKSTTILSTCHRDLQVICREAIKTFDFSIYEGERPIDRQQQLFKDGKSKIDGINKKGKHNYSPSLAFDGAPYPIDFSEDSKKKARFYYWAGVMFTVADRLLQEGKITHKLRWGGDWDSDKDFTDQTFDDLCHFELKK